MKYLAVAVIFLLSCNSNKKDLNNSTVTEPPISKPYVTNDSFIYTRDTNGVIVDSISQSDWKIQVERQKKQKEKEQTIQNNILEFSKKGCAFKHQFGYSRTNKKIIKVTYTNNSSVYIISVQTIYNNYLVEILPHSKGSFFLDKESFDPVSKYISTSNTIKSVIDNSNNKFSEMDNIFISL